jgi:hypothetical protein
LPVFASEYGQALVTRIVDDFNPIPARARFRRANGAVR